MSKNIWDIEKMMGLKRFDSPYYTGGFYYQGTMATGDFHGIGDYNRGLLDLKIGQHIKFPLSKVYITTIDDGVWQGYSDEDFTPEKIESLVNEIIETYGKRLPSEIEFNELLNRYGIHGIYTG